jgi:hypothetical protein
MKKKTLTTAAVVISALLFTAAVAAFAGSAQANPIINVYRDIPPPEGTEAPTVTIHTPMNGSSYPKNLTLTFDAAIPQTDGGKSLYDSYAITKIYYRCSWEPNEITAAEKCAGSFSVDLSDVRGGNLSVTVYAVSVGYIETGEEYRQENNVLWSYHYKDRFEMTGSSTVDFIKDLVPPRITVLSPANKTYPASDVELNFNVNEAASEILYCLDGKENQTITGNVTLRGLTEGTHKITLYAADLAGNPATPETQFFDVNPPESFTVPAAVSVAAAAIAGLALLTYFKKRKH